jgi:hypothetical protein
MVGFMLKGSKVIKVQRFFFVERIHRVGISDFHSILSFYKKSSFIEALLTFRFSGILVIRRLEHLLSVTPILTRPAWFSATLGLQAE